MRNLLIAAPLPLLACLVVACSGAPDVDSTSPYDGESTLALEAMDDGSADTDADAEEGDADVVDKGRHGSESFRRALKHARRHGHWHHFHRGHHHPLPAEPDPEPTPEPEPEPSADACQVAGQSFADGSSVPSGDSCNTCSCSDGNVSCTEAQCEPTICALFIETSDGVCSRFPLDPCIAQDPDCTSDGGACEVAGDSFPNGSEIPSGDSCNSCSCNDGAVICTLALCGPVICAQFIEQADGECSRLPLDPCKSQDPDCVDPSEPEEPETPPPFNDPVITKNPLQPAP